MILGEFKELFLMFSGLVFLSSILLYLILVIVKFKTIIRAFKKIPGWFIFINLVILVYKLFIIPPTVVRQNFGLWILSMAKDETIWTVLLNQRAPVYFFIIKVFSLLLDGVGFVFISNFNIVLSFLTAFFVYYIAFVLLKDKLAACLSALFYVLACPIFIYSMTECYTNPALFFAIQALFFITLYINKREYSFLFLGIASSYLAVGSRPEYIIFDLIFLVFIYLFAKNIKIKHYAFYFILFLPKFFVALNMYLENITQDEFLIGKTFVFHNLPDFIYDIFIYRWQDFINDFQANFLAIINPFSLMGILLLFALFFVVNWEKSKPQWKKVYLFFIFYYFVFFFYYSFLHRDGISGSFKYIASMVLPLSILASMGLRALLGSRYKIGYYLILFIFLVYSLWIGSPLTYGMYSQIDPRVSGSNIFALFNNQYMNQYLRSNPSVFKEWDEYKALTINNRYSHLINSASIVNILDRADRKNDINLTNNNFFIANGARSFLYTIPITEEIYKPISLPELERILKKVKKNDNVYISQGILGFDKGNDHYISGFKAINPIEFEEYIKERLFLEEEIISYYDNDHHVFLYKMRKDIP